LDVFLKMEGEGWVLCTKTAAAAAVWKWEDLDQISKIAS
jgi:hypothetical protein